MTKADFHWVGRCVGLRLASWVIACAVGLAGLGSTAGNGRADTLEDALSIAYTSNPQLLAERAMLEATNEKVPQAVANWRPTVTVTVTGGKDRVSASENCTVVAGFGACAQNFFGQVFPQPGPSLYLGKVKTYQSTYSVTISQPLYRGGRTAAETSQAYNLVNSERGHLAAVEQTVFATVVSDYLGVLLQREQLDLNRANETSLQKQMEATESRYKLGELTHTDLYLAEAAYAQATAGRKTAEGQLESAYAAYQHDIGQAPGDLAKPSVLPQLPATRDEAEGIAAVAAPSVIEAQYAQQAAEDNIDVIRGQLLPTITAQAQYARSSDVVNLGEKVTDKRITAQGSLPLYDGGSVEAQSRAAQKTVAQLKQQVDDSRRAAVQAAQQNWDTLQAARAAIVNLQDAVLTNQKALDGLDKEAHVGTRTVQDVLIQQQALFQAQINLSQAQHDELLDEFNLVASVGRLTARNLGLAVEYYDPEAHLDAVRDKWLGFGTEP
jgi:outer membrane protein